MQYELISSQMLYPKTIMKYILEYILKMCSYIRFREHKEKLSDETTANVTESNGCRIRIHLLEINSLRHFCFR